MTPFNIAKRALGVSENKLTWARNRTDYFLYCPKTKKDLRVFDHVRLFITFYPTGVFQILLPKG